MLMHGDARAIHKRQSPKHADDAFWQSSTAQQKQGPRQPTHLQLPCWELPFDPKPVTPKSSTLAAYLVPLKAYHRPGGNTGVVLACHTRIPPAQFIKIQQLLYLLLQHIRIDVRYREGPLPGVLPQHQQQGAAVLGPQVAQNVQRHFFELVNDSLQVRSCGCVLVACSKMGL